VCRVVAVVRVIVTSLGTSLFVRMIMRTRVLAGFSRARRVLSFNDSCRFKARRTRACEWEMARGESSRTVLRPSLALSKRRLNASNLDRKPRSGEEITSSAYSADNMFGHIYIYIYICLHFTTRITYSVRYVCGRAGVQDI